MLDGARVLVNARPLLPPRSGVGRYLAELLAAMAPLAPSARFDLFYHASLRRRRSVLAGQARLPYQNVRHRIVRIPFRAFGMLADRGWPLERFIGPVDLYFEPNYLPLPARAPLVLSVHDLSYLRCPETMPPDRAKAMARGVPSALQRARAVLVLTSHVRDDLVRELGIPTEKIVVTSAAVGPDFRRPPDVARDAVLARYGLDPGYVLCVANLEPRKGIELLLAAHRAMPPPAPPLVIVGRPAWGESATLPALAASPSVRFLTDAGDADLPALYAGARLFCYPSRYEGFGLPVLEAMACGTPVLCSEAVAEVAGDAAVVVPMREADAWAAEMARLIADDAARKALVGRGFERAAAFTWDGCARRALAAFEAVLAGALPR